MCTISVPCPLCSQISFTSVASLRISLIKAVNSPLSCPICQEVVMGLDKLTLHLITHSNSINNEYYTNNTFIQKELHEETTNCAITKNNNNNVQINYNVPLEQKSSYQIYIEPISALAKEKENAEIKANKKYISKFESHMDGTMKPHIDDSKCNFCGKAFQSFDILQKHKKVMHYLETNNCNENLNSVKNFTNNYESVNSTQMYPCHLCSKSYKIKARLGLHLKVKHLIGLTGCPDKNLSKLNICEKIRLINKKQKDKLDAQNTSENLWIKSIIHNPQLINNKLLCESTMDNAVIRNETVKTWQCDICSKFYTTKYFLKKHKRIHTGETPYACEICNKAFTFQQSYHKHLLYHSDEKPHICKTCGRAFKELSTLHNHERIHSGEKPFQCETCGKRFRQRVSNYVHQRTHTGIKPYNCNICNKKFRYKVTLRTHKCNGSINPVFSFPDITEHLSENKHNKLLQTSTISSIEINRNLTNFSKEQVKKKVDNTLNLVKSTKNKLLTEADDTNSICLINNLNESKPTSFLNEEMLSKSIDDIVAESCRHLFKDHPDFNCTTPDCLDGIPSPTEQFKNLCLYSPIAMENSDQITKESLKN